MQPRPRCWGPPSHVTQGFYGLESLKTIKYKRHHRLYIGSQHRLYRKHMAETQYRNLGLSFMDSSGWHQLGSVTTINTLQYGTNNILRNNKHFENEHKVARANQAGLSVFLCVHLLLQWRSIELKRSLWFALSAPAWLSVCSLIILSSFSSV